MRRFADDRFLRGIGVALLLAWSVAAADPDTEWGDLAAAYDAGVASGGSPIEELTLPLELYDNGRVRAVLYAHRATIGDGGFVRAEKVRVDLFSITGVKEGWLTAEGCLFNRDEKRGYCRGAVALVRSEVELHGVDLYWSMPQQRIVMLSKSRLLVKQWKIGSKEDK